MFDFFLIFNFIPQFDWNRKSKVDKAFRSSQKDRNILEKQKTFHEFIHATDSSRKNRKWRFWTRRNRTWSSTRMFIIFSFILDLCRNDDDWGDGRCGRRSQSMMRAAKGCQVCRRSRNRNTYKKGTTNNNERAKQDRERVWYEYKCKKDQIDEILHEKKQARSW